MALHSPMPLGLGSSSFFWISKYLKEVTQASFFHVQEVHWMDERQKTFMGHLAR